MDFDEDVLVVTAPPTQPTKPDRQAWNRYPQSSFPNWTDTQVNRCKMLTACPKGESKVFKVDVFHNGRFSEDDPEIATIKDSQTEAEFWDWLQGPVSPLVSRFADIENIMVFAEGGEHPRAISFR